MSTPVRAFSSISNGCSCTHGTHQEAQKLTMETLPEARSRLVKPGTAPLSSRRASSGGKSVAGAGLPISAEGSREGSPERRANANSPAMAANNRSGTTRPSRRRGRSRLAGSG
jgi:hypothetical protein